MSDIKLKAASGGGSISLKGPSSLGSDRDLVDTSGNINLLDEQKLNAGTGNDLQVYHSDTGNASYITHSGAGKLHIASTGDDAYLKSSENVALMVNDTEIGVYVIKNGKVSLYHDNTEQCYTSANGLAFPSGKGIDFSANTDEGSTSSATLFEDYEEGTFTPYLKGSTNGGTYSSAGTGQYTKIGNICHVMIRFNGIDLDDNAQGSVQLTGMPYTGSNGGSTSTVAGITSNFELHNVTFHTDYKYSWYLNNNGTTWYGLRSRSGTTWQDWGVEDFRASGTYIDFMNSYRTT